jgi:hypothetical protein
MQHFLPYARRTHTRISSIRICIACMNRPACRHEPACMHAVAYVADGEENKNAVGLGIKKIRVLRRRGTGPVRVLFYDAESGRRLRINRHVELCR